MSTMDARHWLRANRYDDIADEIDRIIATWKVAGKRTRRNWWDILAGDPDGNPRKVAGRAFPVIRAIQFRNYGRVMEGSIQRARHETAPPIAPIGRWAKSWTRRGKVRRRRSGDLSRL